MAKKSRTGGEAPVKGAGSGKYAGELLSFRFDNAELAVVKQHILILIGVSLLTKLAVLFITPVVFHSFIDYFDLGYYFEQAVLLTQGQLPYLHFSLDYPVLLLVPMTISLLPALALQNAMAFIYTFQLLMVACDIVTVLCVYLIALKIGNEKTAYLAGLVYATAFSTAYFVMTKYDAFPTCLLMLALLFTVFGMTMKGYLAAGLGFFTKIFPAISFPFLILYNAKKSSLKEESFAFLKVLIPLIAILLLPILIIRPDAIRTYLFATGSGAGMYVNTATYTVYGWLSGVGHLGITPETVSLVMYGLMGLILLCLLYSAYTDTQKRPVTLLKTLLCALVAVVVFTKFHSPQYLVWFTPLLCLLVADDLKKILLFYTVQVLAYIEFPLMFGSFYTNLAYSSPAGSGGWYLTLLFFTVEYLVLFVLVAVIVVPKGGLIRLFGRKST